MLGLPIYSQPPLPKLLLQNDTFVRNNKKSFIEGTVDSAVASDTRGPGFESSHRRLLLNNYLLLTVCRKDENKEKEARNGQL